MKEKKPDKNNIGVLSWIINVILLSAFWPAGVVLLLMRLSGNDVLSRILMRLFSKLEEDRDEASRTDPLMPRAHSSSQSRAARQGYTPPAPQQHGQPRAESGSEFKAAPVQQAQAKAREEKKRDTVARIGKGRTLLIIFGWVLLAAGVLTVFDPLSRGALWGVLECLAVALGGGGMLFASWKKGKKEQDYQNCTYCTNLNCPIRRTPYDPAKAAELRK